MGMNKENYERYVQVLKEELVPAMGCTEPIAIAYCAAKAREVLGTEVDRVEVSASGNIIKNVKSVIVPNTGGRKGIEAAAAIGIVAGDACRALQVIAQVSEQQQKQLEAFLVHTPITVRRLDSAQALDLIVRVYHQEHTAAVRITRAHDNITAIEKDGKALEITDAACTDADVTQSDRSFLNVADILEFADTVELSEVEALLQRQIACNMAIANEGLRGDYGANIGSVLLAMDAQSVYNQCKAYAAAGSDARMSGCELAVIINSGSGNQGMTASIPVVVWGRAHQAQKERLYRSLLVSNLITTHLKSGIGKLSAYCGVVSAGCGAACGICYQDGGDLCAVSHTLVNAIAMISGTVCDGAKPSCAAKIASAVEAGLLGYEMYRHGQQFRDGEGIVSKGVENTIHNIALLARKGMQETDREIIDIMIGC